LEFGEIRAIMIKGIGLRFLLPDLAIIGIFAILTQILGNVMLLMALSGKSKARKAKKGRGKKNGEESSQQSPFVAGVAPESNDVGLNNLQ